MKTGRIAAALTIGGLMIGGGTSLSAATLPTVTSANLTAHFDASDINNNGGTTDPGDGNDVNTWSNLVSGQTLNHNAPIDGKPTFIAAGSGGIGNQDTVRFVSDGFGTNAGAGDLQADDLLYNNSITFSARTIIAVATMNSKTTGNLGTLLSNSGAGLNIRQTTSNIPSYFTGNSGDFLNGTGAGSFNINGNPRYDIPGGFGAAHVLKLIRNSNATYSGLRFSDNVAQDRRWNGDIAEVLVFDGVLSGNDIARVNHYLVDKYGIAQVVDELTSNTSQVADDPFGGQGSKHVAVNFHYNGPTVGTTYKGIGFDNVNVATLPTGPIALTANAMTSGATLSLVWSGFTIDNNQRTQTAGFTGTDSATLNAVANEMFYLSNPSLLPASNHLGVTMTFAGLDANAATYVQVLGGDDGWGGDIQVIANGLTVNWTTVANGSGLTGSILGFWATTDALGELDVSFAVNAGNFAGIGGIIVSQLVPAPAALPGALALAGLLSRRPRRRG